MPPKHRSLINGPGGLRLQDVATSVGLIHLVILHFFGSRDGLMRALNERILEDLRGRLISILERRDPASPDSLDQLLDGVFTVFRGGLAQWLVWLGADAVPADNPPAAIFRQIRGRDARIPSDHAAERDGPLAPRHQDAGVPRRRDRPERRRFGPELLGKAPGAQTGEAEQKFRPDWPGSCRTISPPGKPTTFPLTRSSHASCRRSYAILT
jgi:AcrR family transcriptional regulator